MPPLSTNPLTTARKPPASTKGNIPAVPELSSPRSRQELLQQEEMLKIRLLANPTDENMVAQLAAVYQQQGKYHAAAALLKPYTQQEGRRPDWETQRATALAKAGETREAEKIARAVLAQEKNHRDANALLGHLLLKRGDNYEGLAALEEAVKAYPPSVEAELDLADWEYQRGELPAAEDHLRHALLHDPKRTDIRRFYARVLAERDNLPEAIVQWQWLLQRGEAGAEGHFALARLYHRQDELVAAFNHYEDAVRLAPGASEREPIEQLLTRRAAAPQRPLEYRPLLSSRR